MITKERSSLVIRLGRGEGGLGQMISIENAHPKNAELRTFPRLDKDWLLSDFTHIPQAEHKPSYFVR